MVVPTTWSPASAMPAPVAPSTNASAFNKKVHLLWTGIGSAEESLLSAARASHEALDKAGIKNVLYESPGTAHEWQTWRRDLLEFASRLFKD